MIRNKFFTGFYTRRAHIFLYKGVGEKRAKQKAYIKTLLLSGAFYFFIYIFFMNVLNRLFFDLPNSRTVGYLVTGPFVLLYYLLIGERMLKPYLKQITLNREVTSEEFRRYENRNNIIAIMAGLYAAAMFVLIRMSNIHIFPAEPAE